MVRSLSRILRAAKVAAPPEITSDRLAKVPHPYGVRSVSPCTTRTCAGTTPIVSATSCESVVARPCPCGLAPIRASTAPDGSMTISTVSQPGVISMPRAVNAGLP
jgi:hypothetical protein